MSYSMKPVLKQIWRTSNRIIDYLALVGDTVDGVPGVTKCGPKALLNG